jgi:hypothetical protein
MRTTHLPPPHLPNATQRPNPHSHPKIDPEQGPPQRVREIQQRRFPHLGKWPLGDLIVPPILHLRDLIVPIGIDIDDYSLISL